MKKLLICLSICVASPACKPAPPESKPAASAIAAPSPAKQIKCTSEPCANTATGEDPQAIASRAAFKARDAANSSNTDQERWAEPIYSDSTRPEQLQLDVIKSAGFKLRLLPQPGHIVFERAGAQDIFQISTPKGTKDSACPKYSISVIDAGDTYALIKMNCQLYEYKPNRFSMSSDYYLYDAKSAILRNTWSAIASSKQDKFPSAKPKPAVKRIADGYQFDWTGVMPNDPTQRNVDIHNKYQWKLEKDTGKTELVCTDVSAPKSAGVEGEKCSGGILPLVSSMQRQ
jgi:hypothetical protein